MPERASQYRKKPRQQRSQATVDALLKATAQLLEERGYARLTTNHIARRAGVSIGSLYQYFPGKDALCHALAERHFGNYAQRYLARLEAVAQTPLETQVRELVRLNFEIAREDPGMARALYHELSRIGGLDPLQRTRAAVIQALESRYRALPAAWRLAHPDMTAFIITVACGALVGEIVMYRPEWLHDDAFIEQITQLVLGYYQRLGWQPARQDSRKHG
jgi:AcrR family transcriptional regulator